ncbi:MAG: Glu-tRNA(Gln) amidotransferase subunit GatE [Candidatus Ranarchaeia archaeon]
MKSKPIDYKEIGLMVGLEIHQQLDTKTKLFCNCPTIHSEGEPDYLIWRKLRPTQSEFGTVDRAALFEFLKGKPFVYEGFNESSCLVEQDEEPPHSLDKESIDIGLTVSLLLNSNIVNEIHIMRKIVIDGSNTGGFQRTAVISLGGEIEDEEFGRIGIQAICLEEDAARKISEDKNEINYRLYRLGVPLIEVATAPDINDPYIAEKVALKIGQIIRSTMKVKRGLGTIRQDVNISIREGNLVEIKGVQSLDIISDLIIQEVNRQIELLKIRDELQNRKITLVDLKRNYVNISLIFSNTKSKLINKVLKNKGIVLAVKLPRCKNILGWGIQQNRRFGTELSDYVKFSSGLKGIFHSDELPNYGITEDEIKEINNKLNLSENDAFVFVAGEKELVEKALDSIQDRISIALSEVPKETRGANPDGTTFYLRPRPGASRMYPETDVESIIIPEAKIKKLTKNLPETFEEKANKFKKELKINQSLANKIIKSQRLPLFEKIYKKTKTDPVLIIHVLENIWVNLRREGIILDKIDENKIIEIFIMLKNKKISRETLEDLLIYIEKNPKSNLKDSIDNLGLTKASDKALEEFIEKLIQQNLPLVKEKGERAIGGLMGDVMKHFKKNIDGKIANKLLKEKIREINQK